MSFNIVPMLEESAILWLCMISTCT